MKKSRGGFRFAKFSKKQKQVLTWWNEKSPVKDKDAIICDGSVRAGKTIVMSLSFVMWAMATFSGQNLGMAGKTIGSFRRNVLFLLKIILRLRGYRVEDKRADNYLIVRRGDIENYFYIFGGKDERSQDLIQGITLAGMLFDEVALMPESFVNQATARCSVEGAKFWFNCNPEGPYHWFKVNWLDRLKEKNAIHLHFTMDDNPSLSEKVKERYKRLYSGVFFKRYILGLWVIAEGIIYDMFSEETHIVDEKNKYWPKDNKFEEYYIAIDYGTQNACVFLLIGKYKGRYFIVDEYYYSGKEEGKQKSDPNYFADFEKFVQGIKIKKIIIDPSAASFITLLKENGYSVKKAINDVVDGIREVSKRLSNLELFVHKRCKNTIKEFSSYTWDAKATERGEDKPVKKFDHAMDALRYFVYTILVKKAKDAFMATAGER
ncbi:PBSX family phage terminase large subunit [Crassaminicella thermophila]|uniref:PBSX family phage terminase large subunit n=1 Tax=Crassaminicella thermophila TaxID=2599308 RepID=A0A5C0SHP8_CRATE|nr:PBSX family phage terminase large subunit [Crassaminicella thermophila]QEK12728.1 PBSX family phage terminase large subunit [Crassaminicella thermophila]